MPISDEVIELAPVKKTKKTLIIMLSVIGVLFALAVTFLVLYFLKPSVTAEKNNVKGITLNSTELFSVVEGDEETLYASIGNEYTVYATITVENGASANVQWDWPRDLIEVKEEQSEDGAYLKFIPRTGTHGKTATIKARAASKVEESQSVTFTIVNQGAEDLQVVSYGVRNNLQTVSGDNISKELAITVPYYTMSQSPNNQPVIINFKQLGKYNSTSGEYAKLTALTVDGNPTNAVSVTTDKEGADVITVSNISANSFTFTPKKQGTATITLTANVNNNVDCKEITKTIKVTVEPNTTSGYVDSMYFFNKPTVDVGFIKSVLQSGNNISVDSAKVKALVSSDDSLEVVSSDRNVPDSDGFAFVLPYSATATYDNIFDHLLLNPANIQYSGDELKENWFSNIKVTSSDSNVLKVNTDTKTGAVSLSPKGVSGLVDGKASCTLTFTDNKPGSAGASVSVPVIIIAQNRQDGGAISAKNDTSVFENAEDIAAVTGGKFTVTVTYTFGVPGTVDKVETMQSLMESGCINNTYSLNFDKDELAVKLVGGKDNLESGKVYTVESFTFEKVAGGTTTLTLYKASISFEVEVTKSNDGKAWLQYNKIGYTLAQNSGLDGLDADWTVQAAFVITERATSAKIIEDVETGLNIVTDNNSYAGNFVRKSDTQAALYVQNRSLNTVFELSQLENLKPFVDAHSAYFTLSKYEIVTSGNSGVFAATGTGDSRHLVFQGAATPDLNTLCATLKFDVLDVGGTSIATLQLDIYVIDAVTDIVITDDEKTVAYSGTQNGTITLLQNDIQVKHYLNSAATRFAYTAVRMYYGNNMEFDVSVSGTVYTFGYEGTELYSVNTSNRQFSTLTDIYAFSYEKGIDFSRIEVEFLLNDTDEYVGKNYGIEYIYKNRLSMTFERRADSVAMFTNADCAEADAIAYTAIDNTFKTSVNQNDFAALAASSIIYLNGNKNNAVYASRKSEVKGQIAAVQNAYFNVPSGIAVSTSSKVTDKVGDFYYSITYTAPTISGESQIYEFTVFYGDNDTAKLQLTVENAVRIINKIELFSDANCQTAVSQDGLIFGGFINNNNQNTQTIYIKVSYVAYESRHTSFQKVVLTLPSYLVLNDGEPQGGAYNTYNFQPTDGISDINEKVFACTIKLVDGTGAQPVGQLKVAPSSSSGDESAVGCNVTVSSGLKNIAVTKDDALTPECTITAGQTGTVSHTFELSDTADVQSVTLNFAYGSIAPTILFDHTSTDFAVNGTATVDGLEIVNNIKAASSSLTIKITSDSTKVKTLDGQVLTFTFVDNNNGTNSGNVFTLNIKITVKMDVFELGFADNSYAVTVVGGGAGEQTLPINVKYNGDSVQPTSAIVNSIDVVDIYVLDNGKYVKFNDNDKIGITKTVTGGSAIYTLYVADNIERNVQYYVGLAYDNVSFDSEKHIRPITINTLACHIEFDENNVELVKNGTDLIANVVVDGDNKTFRLAVNVVNDGTGAVVSGKTVTYQLFKDLNDTPAEGDVAISANGIITVIPKNKISNTLYYRATYTDANSGKTYYLYAVFNYSIAPSEVNIVGVDSSVYDSANKTLTLYYGADGSKTAINLGGKIVASNAFNIAYGEEVATSIALKNAADSEYVNVNGYSITPKIVAVPTSVTLVVSAKYADKTVTSEYTVNIVPIQPVSFAVDNGNLSIVDNTDSLTVTPVINSYSGLTPAYTLVADVNNQFAISSGVGNAKTITIASGSTVEKGKTYTFTATLGYTFGSSSGVSATGTFASTAKYSVTVIGDYTPTFDILSNGSTVVPTYDSATGSTLYSLTPGAAYSIKVNSDDSKFAVTYSATATNDIISIGAFSGKTATVTVNENASGAFNVTVSAKVGGTTFKSAEQHYYFTYGQNATAKLYMSENNGAFVEFTGATQAIDYATDPYRFKYEISDIPSEVLNNTDNVTLVVNGNVTVGAITKDGDKLYAIITPNGDTTMLIGGYVTIGSRTVYLENKSVTLTSIAPDFAISGADEVTNAQSITLSVSKAEGFIGTYTTAYQIVSGGEYATMSGAVLTAKSTVTSDKSVVVRVTVKVTSGLYSGTTYTIDKLITVVGVALPTVSWKSTAERYVTVGVAQTYSANDYTFANVDSTYSYSGKISYAMTASGTLLSGTDYTFSNGTLTVNNTANTRAGGKIVLTVTATITSGAHNGETVSDTIDVYVLPTVSAGSAITLANARNTHDFNSGTIKSAFVPNVGNGENSFKSTDEYGIVGLTVNGAYDAQTFGVDGGKLIVKQNITSETTLNITVEIYISTGVYKGATVKCNSTVTFAVPAEGTENFAWNNTANKYNDLMLGKSNVLGAAINGTVSSIDVIGIENGEYLTVTDNGTASPTISVDKSFGAYVGNLPQARVIKVAYTVTLDNGSVYYSTATYSADSVAVTVSATIGDTEVDNSIGVAVNSGESVILKFAATHGFAVSVESVVIPDGDSAYLKQSSGGNSVQFSAQEVTSDRTISVTVKLAVAGTETEYSFGITVKAPETQAAYTANSTDNILAAGSNSSVTSTWTNQSTYYQYGYSVTVTAPGSDYLSKYFSSLQVNSNTPTTSLNRNSVTLYVNSNQSHENVTKSFNLNMQFNTTAALPLSVIEVKFVVYSGSRIGYYTTVTVQYRLRVIDTVAVTLDTNAGGDEVTLAGGNTANVKYLGTYALPTPVRTGYVFNGWYDYAVAEDDESAKNYVGQTVVKTDAHTLYAHWSPISSRVAFNSDGGSTTGLSPITVTYGSTYGTLPNTTRTGYTFVGWFTSGGDIVTANTVVNIETDITLTAHWTPNAYTVTLDPNGGILAGNTSVYEIKADYGSVFGLHTVIVPTRDGYTFGGWYNGSAHESSVITVTGNITLTAHWTANEYTVTLDPNGGTLAGDPETKVAYGNKYSVDDVADPTRSGFTFDGWYNGDVKVSGDMTVTDNVTLTAHWTANEYTVTLNAGDGILSNGGNTYTVSVAYGTKVDIHTVIIPTRDGFTFDGWYNGDAAVVDEITVTDNVTLTAHWQAVGEGD